MESTSEATQTLPPDTPENRSLSQDIAINQFKCLGCRDLDSYKNITTLQKLLEGEKKGCPSCSLIARGISHFIPDFFREVIERVDWEVVYGLQVKPKFIDGGSTGTIEFFTELGRPSKWELFGPARLVSEDPGLPEQTILLAKDWLARCLSSHPRCPQSRSAQLPTRIIDVGNSDTDVRLVLTQGEKAPYVALSHCWGKCQALRATTANVSSLQNHIEFASTDLTFHQAVVATRILGYRYLWIDSLCILQDSPDDWAKEAARMSKVYGDATLTLAADSAQDTTEGLFPKVENRKSSTELLRLECPGANAGETSVLFVRERAASSRISSHAYHGRTEPKASKLSTRGWVFQERMLSPRTLYFSKEELGWVCNSLSRCECSLATYEAPQTNLFRNPDSPLGLELGKPLSSLFQSEWPRAVMDFTHLDLSHPDDRLPALAGLAAMVHERTGDQYLCGLWEAELYLHLLWYRDNKDPGNLAASVRQSVVPYAPSWSWASFCGPVSYNSRFLREFGNHDADGWRNRIVENINIVHISIRPTGPNPFGPATGYLVAEALIVPIFPVFEEGKDVETWWPLTDKVEDSVIKELWDIPEAVFDVPSEREDIRTNSNNRFFFFMIVVCRTRMASLWGLLLEQLEPTSVDTSGIEEDEVHLDPDGPELGRYKRLGMMVTADSEKLGVVADRRKVMLKLV